MAKASDFLETALLDHVFRNTAYTSPSTVYVALYHDDPTDADIGTEVTGGSYVRKAATFGAASSPGGTITTSADVIYTGMPSTTSTPITHFGIHDAETDGNLLVYGEFDASKVTNAGDTLTIPSTDLTVTLA